MTSAISTNLVSYVQDHLAGATAALELLNHLTGHCENQDERNELGELAKEITADRNTLLNLLAELNGKEGLAKNATAWLTEKATQMKLLVSGPRPGGLGRLEGLELLAIGIEGKRALWTALLSVSDCVEPVQFLNFDELLKRVVDQRRRVEELRLGAARAAFVDTGQP